MGSHKKKILIGRAIKEKKYRRPLSSSQGEIKCLNCTAIKKVTFFCRFPIDSLETNGSIMISRTMASLDVFTTRLSQLIIFKKFGLDPNEDSLTYQDFDQEDD